MRPVLLGFRMGGIQVIALTGPPGEVLHSELGADDVSIIRALAWCDDHGCRVANREAMALVLGCGAAQA